MLRPVCLALVLSVILGTPARSPAQDRPAPLYSLPGDGTWVEYQWTAFNDGKAGQAGVLRISSVGHKDVKGVRHRWVEIKRESQPADPAQRKLRKLLVAEQAFGEGRPLPECLAACLDHNAADGSVTRLSAQRVHDFLGMGFADRDAGFRTIQAKVEVETRLGKFVTRHVSAEGGSGRRTLDYQGWLTRDVPFGWAKFEIHERIGNGPSHILFRAVAARSGAGARSEVDESKVR